MWATDDGCDPDERRRESHEDAHETKERWCAIEEWRESPTDEVNRPTHPTMAAGSEVGGSVLNEDPVHGQAALAALSFETLARRVTDVGGDPSMAHEKSELVALAWRTGVRVTPPSNELGGGEAGAGANAALLDASTMTLERLTNVELSQRYIELGALATREDTRDDNLARIKASRKTVGLELARRRVPWQSKLSVLVVTWNLGNQPAMAEELEEVFPTRGMRSGYDIVVVGLQECSHGLTTAQAVVAEEYLKAKAEGGDARTPVSSVDGGLATYASAGAGPRENNPAMSDRVAHGLARATTMTIGETIERTAKYMMTSRAGAYFAEMLRRHIGKDLFCAVGDSEMVQMRLFVFARVEARSRITHLEALSKTAGIAHMPNKGGVTVAFDLDGTRLGFVSCHLAAHRGYVANRNAAVADILSMVHHKMRVGKTSSSYLSRFEHFFLIGDLNYRLDPEATATKPTASEASSVGGSGGGGAGFSSQSYSSTSAETRQGDGVKPAAGSATTSPTPASDDDDREDSLDSREEGYTEPTTRPLVVRSSEDPDEKRKRGVDHTAAERALVLDLIERREFGSLMGFDQLRREQAAGNVLVGFSEARELPFPPTFKVARAPGHVYNEKRLPSYCDRILWRSSPALERADQGVVQEAVWSAEGVTSSDHKPVSSLFLLRLIDTGPAASIVPRTMTMSPSLRFGFRAPRLPVLYRQDLRHRTGMQLVVSRLRARGLASMDPTGGSDPYVMLFSSQVFDPDSPGADPNVGAARTRVRMGSLNPSWREKLVCRLGGRFVTPETLLGTHVTLAVWDFDSISNDDLMGEVVLCLDDAVRAFSTKTALVTYDSSREPQLAPPDMREDDRQHLLAATSPPGSDFASPKPSFRRRQRPAPGEVAFELPLHLNGRNYGVLAGVARLASPTEKLDYGKVLQGFGGCWKCGAYFESYAPQRRSQRSGASGGDSMHATSSSAGAPTQLDIPNDSNV